MLAQEGSVLRPLLPAPCLFFSGFSPAPQNTMFRTLSSLLLALFVGLAATASPAQAQNKRAGDTFYLKFGAGFSDYTGDFADPFEGFSDGDGFPYGWVGEVGYQTSPAFAIGLGFQAGRYPLVNNGVSDANPHRLSGQLLGRYTFGAESWTVAPYVDAGANLSFASRSFDDTGGGPTFGVGIDIPVSDWASFYAEARSNLTYGDDAMDGVEQNTGLDGLSHLGVGLKMNFSSATTPPRVISIDGPTSVEAEETVTYTASVNQEEATRPLTYRWDFGDGSTGSGLTAEQTFQEAGSYPVQFTASNEAGEASQTLTVSVAEAPEPASIVSINATPNPVDEGEPVSFSANVQGESPISYDWDLGDGSTAEGGSPSHTYEEPGTYTVGLTASNEAGENSQTLTMTVERALPSVCMTTEELNSTFFERNSSTLTENGEESLQENLDVLTKCPNLDVRAEGFAAPNERNSQELSEDRAEVVTEFYEEGGISSDRITSEGQGAPEGVTTKKGDTQQYRRVDSIPQQQ